MGHMARSGSFAALLLPLLVCLPFSTCDDSMRIPRVLHRNFMGGADALLQAVQDPQSGFKAHWLASCRTHNPGWQEIIWDAAAVLKLVQDDFSWFLPTYLSYTKIVQRSDVTRYMVLYKYGGVYLDADVECYSQLEPTLKGKDLVLNCEYPEAQAQLHNAVMASAPGHPFWLEVLKEAMARAPNHPQGLPPLDSFPELTGSNRNIGGSSSELLYKANRGSFGAVGSASEASTVWGSASSRSRQLLGKLKEMWEASPFHDKVHAVLKTTGPIMLTSVYQRYTGEGPTCGRSVEVDGRVSHTYELGSWFTPCFWGDEECQRKWITQHMLLVRNNSNAEQQRGSQQAAATVIGIHHYSGSWTDWDLSSKQQKQQQLLVKASAQVAAFFADSPLFLEYKCSTQLLSDSSVRSSTQHATCSSTGMLADSSSSSSCWDSAGGSAADACSSVSHQGSSSCSSSSTGSSDTCVAKSSSSTGGGGRACVPRHPIPLCMEFVSDAAVTGSCAVVTVLGPKAPAAGGEVHIHRGPPAAARTYDAEGSVAIDAAHADVATELLLQQLGCHVMVVSPDTTPPKPLQALMRTQSSTKWAADSKSSTNSCSNGCNLITREGRRHGGNVRHIHGIIAPLNAGVVAQQQQASMVSLHELLRLDPRDEESQQSQIAEMAASSSNKNATQRMPLRYILRLSCGGCELSVLQHMFDNPGPQADVLQQVDLLILDTRLEQLAAEAAQAAAAAAVASLPPMMAANAPTNAAVQSCNVQKTATGTCSFSSMDVSSSNSKRSSDESLHDSNSGASELIAVYNLLYQQHGFVGFMRQQLPKGVLRLGFARQPSRMAASAAVFDHVMDD